MTHAVTADEAATLDALTPDQIENVYEGTAGRCACGCSGTYYEDGPKVAAILRRVQRRGRKAAAGEVEPLDTYTYSNGAIMWAYYTSTRLIRIESKPPAKDSLDPGDPASVAFGSVGNADAPGVTFISPGTPEWDASEVALEAQRRQGG